MGEDRARDRRIWLAFAFTALCLTSCEFVPGTDAFQQARARTAVSQTLIDPSSATFRNVETRQGFVCGEVNGKNRMGAYTGFVRFYVEMANWRPALDPQFDPAMLESARALCASGSGTNSSSCRRESEEEVTQILQNVFDSTWLAHCEGGALRAVQLPFDPTGGGSGDSNAEEAENVADLNAFDDSLSGVSAMNTADFDPEPAQIATATGSNNSVDANLLYPDD